jgi:hypothetical protein
MRLFDFLGIIGRHAAVADAPRKQINLADLFELAQSLSEFEDVADLTARVGVAAHLDAVAAYEPVKTDELDIHGYRASTRAWLQGR